MSKERIAQRVRTLRESAGMTQFDLSERAKIANRALQHLEGAGGNPTMDTLAAVAEALGVGVIDLIGPDKTPAEQGIISASRAHFEQALAIMERQITLVPSECLNAFASAAPWLREQMAEVALELYRSGGRNLDGPTDADLDAALLEADLLIEEHERALSPPSGSKKMRR